MKFEIKRRLAAILSAILIAAMVLPVSQTPVLAATYTAGTYELTGNMTVRSGPDTSYSVLGYLSKGTTIEVFEVKNTKWGRIEFKSKTAYVSLIYSKQIASAQTSDPEATAAPTPKPTATPTPKPTATPVPTQAPSSNGTKYVLNGSMYVRSGPGTSYSTLGSLKKGTTITVYAIENTKWGKIDYNGKTGYVSLIYAKPVDGSASSGSSSSSSSSSTTTGSSVLGKTSSVSTIGTYKDSSLKITVTKEWWQHAWCYIAHVEMSDYTRMKSECANGKYNNGTETTSHAAKRVGAILAINGDYSAPKLDYAVARAGKVWNDKKTYAPGLYNANTGEFFYGDEGSETAGKMLSTLVSEKKVTDTFIFGPAFLRDGVNKLKSNSGSRAQRTFMGTNGKAGDIWMVVADGRNNDGKSEGLNGYECAELLKLKGCTFGIPLDGGGSSTMYWKGKVINAARRNERTYLVDCVYVK